MSQKYRRIREADKHLPAPLRWLTRLFSSITLAVCLLACVALYGTLASVPVAYIVSGAIYVLIGVVCMGAAAVAAVAILNRGSQPGIAVTMARVALAAALFVLAAGMTYLAYVWVSQALSGIPWFIKYRALVVYRLPALEMTELEFYNWWPLRAILSLFVINLIWATIRRIEFSFHNIGVLTVHTGIITIAIGSVIYYSTKVEGDTIVFREDLGGTYVRSFYDGTTPALYIAGEQAAIMVKLDDLPRYNDYQPETGNTLRLRLDEAEGFDRVLGPNVRATVNNFIAYGDLVPKWMPADEDELPSDMRLSNPAVEIRVGDKDGPDLSQPSALLVSGLPSKRVMEGSNWAIELLADPSRQRLDDLTSEFPGFHGLVVEIPSLSFREVYGIAPGQTITVGDTGYMLAIEEIGPYGMPFATAGYQGATDTRATVRVMHSDGMFRRIVMNRYPERSQDFVPVPGDPSVGPMGRRTDPNPIIHLSYIDASKFQIRLIVKRGSPDARPQVLFRLPNDRPILFDAVEDRMPIPGDRWLHLTERMGHAVQRRVPIPTPANERNPKDEGTYIHALLPIDLEADVKQPDGSTKLWKKRVWLEHMRYPDVPITDMAMRDAFNEGRVQTVDIPTVGKVQMMFSREQHDLGFAVQLSEFAMTPYPGSEIPRDYESLLNLRAYDAETDTFAAESTTGVTHLNNPLVHNGLKVSQTGWDPGSQADPDRMRRDAQGRFTNQQRFSILGVGNNRGIYVISAGCTLMVLGIPWAFYVKPMLVQRKKLKIQRELAANPPQPKSPKSTKKSPAAKPEPATVQS